MRSILPLLLALWAGVAEAQIRTDAPGLLEIAGRLLAQGEAERAGELAQALLARDPDDLAALLLLGRASLEAGDWPAALAAARKAHARAGAAEEPGARYLAARIAGRAHAEMGDWTRAQLWLRRAGGDAPDAGALGDLSRELAAVRALNPLSVSLSFGVAPSSNVNGGTSAETVWVWVPLFGGGYLPTTPVGDALPLSGWRVSGGATLSWRLAGDARRGTYLEGQASGRTYVLSEEARETAPGAQGSDYSDLQASLSLVHRWQGQEASGPSAVRLTFGRSWYDWAAYTRFAQVSWDRGVRLARRDRLDLSVFADWTEREGTDRYASVGARARWTHGFGSGDRATLSLGVREHLDEVPDTTWSGVSVGAGYDRGEPVLGLRLGLGAELEWRDYDLSRLEPAGREDWRGTLRATVGMPTFEVWGFEPTVTLEASRTNSDADRIDKETLTLDLAFRSRF